MRKSVKIVVVMVAVVAAGCYTVKPDGKQIGSATGAQATETDSNNPGWGQAAEGVQSRLRAERRQWKTGEEVRLLADVRNQGTSDLMVWQTEMLGEVEVDGQWYKWGGGIDAKSSAFPPGRQYNNIAFTLTNSWVSKKRESRKPELILDVGKHTVRVAFLPKFYEKRDLELIRAVSNAVGIEILPAEDKPAGAGR